MDERIRVVVAGPGAADGDRRAERIARALRDRGVEVVYTDRPHTPEQLLATVVQEDADAVGIVPGGDHEDQLALLSGLMTEHGIDDVLVFAGDDGEPADVAARVSDRLRG
ncbi:cobalamin B12-binding domain-containing protein [Blastococcus sp. SYSU D01042]